MGMFLDDIPNRYIHDIKSYNKWYLSHNECGLRCSTRIQSGTCTLRRVRQMFLDIPHGSIHDWKGLVYGTYPMTNVK